jgi:hypothetical protein
MSNDMGSVVNLIEADLAVLKAEHGQSDFMFSVKQDALRTDQVSVVFSDVFNKEAFPESPLANSVLNYFCNLFQKQPTTQVELIGHSKVDTGLLGMGLVRTSNMVNNFDDYLKDNQCLDNNIVLSKRSMGSRNSIANMVKKESDTLLVSDRIEVIVSFDLAVLASSPSIENSTAFVETYDYVEEDPNLALVEQELLAPVVTPVLDTAAVEQNQTEVIAPSVSVEPKTLKARGHNPVTSDSFSAVRPLPEGRTALEKDLGVTHLYQTQGFDAHRYAMRITRIPVEAYPKYIQAYKEAGLEPERLLYSLSNDGEMAFVYYNFFNFNKDVSEFVKSLPAWIQRDQPFADQLDRK